MRCINYLTAVLIMTIPAAAADKGILELTEEAKELGEKWELSPERDWHRTGCGTPELEFGAYLAFRGERGGNAHYRYGVVVKKAERYKIKLWYRFGGGVLLRWGGLERTLPYVKEWKSVDFAFVIKEDNKAFVSFTVPSNVKKFYFSKLKITRYASG